jgi:AbrB family looped-hinge helix DNA binding protein
MKIASTTTLDAAGRLVLPKSIRLAAGLEPGTPLQITCRDGRVEIEPQPREVRLVRKGKLLVAEPVEPSEPLTDELVQAVRDTLRGAARET